MTLDGGDFENEELSFISNKKANYTSHVEILDVTMANSPYLLYIQLLNIEEGVVGSFSSMEPVSVSAQIFFNDGSDLPEDIQWRYVSAEYEITLEEFGPSNEGWVQGTFSGVLVDQFGGESMTLSDGFFNVPRKE
ncbi:MAG: hypothetical protein ABIK09_15100 [Pseudomonadota bacterium]